MLEIVLPGIRGRAPRACPRCGESAAIHGYIVRVVHDWQAPVARCLRLRCCGVTFTAAPPGITPRSRFSDRVVALARALVAAGVSMRSTARTLSAAGVPLTLQTVRTWCAGIEPVTRARARLTATPDGAAFIRLRPELCLSITGSKPRLIAVLLQRRLGLAVERSAGLPKLAK